MFKSVAICENYMYIIYLKYNIIERGSLYMQRRQPVYLERGMRIEELAEVKKLRQRHRIDLGGCCRRRLVPFLAS